MTDILLVEDDLNIAEAVRFILSREGWKLAHRADGHSVIETLHDLRPRLMILDMMLPGRSGAEILADLRQGGDLRDLPVLILTARGQNRIDPQSVDLATRWLAKPFSNDDLRETVRDMMG